MIVVLLVLILALTASSVVGVYGYRMRKFCLLMIFCLPLLSFSQSSDLGNWLIMFGNKKINDRFNFHHEVQYRNYNAIGDLEQLLLRGGIGYNLTENNNNILFGYAYILSENYLDNGIDKVSMSENRIYQQFITKQTIGRVSIQHRYRFEQRFFENDFRLRLRYFLAANIPLNNEMLTDKTVYISAYNEIFLHADGNPFDRNRLYGGIGYRHNKTFRFELGYLNQFLPNTSRDQIKMITFINF